MFRYLVALFLTLCVTFAPCAAKTRFKRQQFSPLEACTVSHQEIEELIRVTKNLNAPSESVQFDVRAGFDPAAAAANLDKCAKRLTQFRGTLQTVIQSYKSINRDTMNQAQYERAKARYQTDIQRLLRRIDNLKRDVEDRYRGEMENLRSNMQQFKVQLDDNLSQLEKERAKTKDAFVRLCIANIRAGRIKDAVNDFRNLDDLPYQQIVTEVYEDEPKNADLVLNFLEAIDLYYEPLRGYETLFEHMKRHNQLSGHKGRRLLTHIMALVTADDEHSQRASDLMNVFKTNM
ncbi:uncharacterized protein LOC131679730 [Topomyia yanbarensis]|uniref:uncharacterized protein LOC131679730 n=1 Tax=Topomyia yanbarensis TaxID=2498891 RepID=UPI00273A9FF8|nr:uncharacterized protein LOC131679730 [Topomyia yanbarensis]